MTPIQTVRPNRITFLTWIKKRALGENWSFGFVLKGNTTTLMYENIICFFSFPLITRNIRIGRIKEGR